MKLNIQTLLNVIFKRLPRIVIVQPIYTFLKVNLKLMAYDFNTKYCTKMFLTFKSQKNSVKRSRRRHLHVQLTSGKVSNDDGEGNKNVTRSLNLHRFKLHRYNSTSFNLSNVANFSAVVILSDFIQDQKQEKENRCLVFTSFSFTSQSCKDAGKGMNKKA